MATKLMFLGRLEDMAGRAEDEMSPKAPLDWKGILEWLGDWYSPDLVEAVDGHRVKIAINGALVVDKSAIVVGDGDEIAFLPPVSGG